MPASAASPTATLSSSQETAAAAKAAVHARSNRPLVVGILDAYQTPPGLEHLNVDVPSWFTELLQRADPAITTRSFSVHSGEFPATPGECDHYLVTGSPASAYDDNGWAPQLLKWIADVVAIDDPQGPKIVGVCFGHQACCLALGGEVRRSPKGWGVGVREVTLCNLQAWQQPALRQVSVCASHQDQVEVLPPNAVLLGTSDFCSNDIALLYNQHQQPKVFSMQGHIEYPAWFLEALYDLRRAHLNSGHPGLAERALEQVGKCYSEADHLLLAQWAVAFLRS